MGHSDLFLQAISGISWGWFVVATVVVFGFGALWFSVFFRGSWARLFRVDESEITPWRMFRSLFTQLVAGAVFGFAIFLATALSAWLSAVAIIGFCAWEKGGLSFQFVRFRDYALACTIRAGYTFLAGAIFLLFAFI